MARRYTGTWVILVMAAVYVAVLCQPAQAGSASTMPVSSQYVATSGRNLDLWGDVWTAPGGGRVTSLYVSVRAYNGHRGPCGSPARTVSTGCRRPARLRRPHGSPVQRVAVELVHGPRGVAHRIPGDDGLRVRARRHPATSP